MFYANFVLNLPALIKPCLIEIMLSLEIISNLSRIQNNGEEKIQQCSINQRNM